MRFKTKDLDHLFERALRAFLAADSETLLSDVSERNSCGRLSVHLEAELRALGVTDYHADVEYNRKQNGQVKTILDDRLRVITITPDLIVHSRGKNLTNDNLIAIEMKKSDRSEAQKTADRERLMIMTRRSFDGIWSNDGETHPEHVCGYRVGMFIEVDRGRRTLEIQYFKEGAQTKSRAFTF